MTEYADLSAKVEQIVGDPVGADPTVRAYMLARLALLWIATYRGGEKAAEVAYKLADEIATR